MDLEKLLSESGSFSDLVTRYGHAVCAHAFLTEQPKPGGWSLWLRYRYSDDYRIQTVHRVLREDAFDGGTFEVQH